MAIQNERIAMRIKDLELSYAEVAEASNMQKSTVYRYATGERENIPVSVIEALAPVLKTSAAYLMGWCDDPNQDIKPTTTNNDDELQEYLEYLKNREDGRMLFSLAKNATKEDVMRAVAIIEALKKEEERQE